MIGVLAYFDLVTPVQGLSLGQRDGVLEMSQVAGVSHGPKDEETKPEGPPPRSEKFGRGYFRTDDYQAKSAQDKLNDLWEAHEEQKAYGTKFE